MIATTDSGNTPPAEPGEPGLGWRWTAYAGSWIARAVGAVVVAALTLAQHNGANHRTFEIVVLSLLGSLMIVWRVVEGHRRHRRWCLPPSWPLAVTLSVIGALGGIAVPLSPARSVGGFAVMAALAAGYELPFAPACEVVAVGVVGGETGGLVFGFSVAAAFGLPLLLIVSLLAGRTRREARLRADRAVATVRQMRQAHREQQRAAALDERQRVAREIHDVLAHSLSALGLQIEAAEAVLKDTGDVETACRLLGNAHHLANEGLDDTRRAIHALRAGAPPLPDSLAAMVAYHRRHDRQPVDLSVTGQVLPLPPNANLILVRTAQEALSNAAKHAPYAAVTISLDYGVRATTLIVSNVITPHDMSADLVRLAAKDVGGGYGLTGMRERLLLLDGALVAGPTEGGWTVRASVPR
jgi:signal transduction histidine kinase